MTKCYVCEKIIPKEEVPPSKRGVKTTICKACGREKHRETYASNKSKREYHRMYYQDNMERIKNNTKRNKAENPEKHKEYKKRPEVRIRKSQANRIKRAISVTGNAKTYSTLKLVGCTALELKRHIEGQFQEGMSWDNYGFDGWHIDHIKPLASFDLSDPKQQKECFHYSNLQPLWAKDNLKKGASRHD